MKRLSWLCMGLAMIYSGGAIGATVVALGPQALAERSEQIFIGTVIAEEVIAKRSPVQVVTRTTFAVERSLKGPTLPEIVLEQLGGAHGEGDARVVQYVDGYPRFRIGERVLLFLERTDTGRLVVTGLSQGKYLLTATDPDGSVVATRDIGNLAIRGRRHAADVHVAGVPRNHERLLLTHLEALIEGRRPVPIPLMVRPTAPVTRRGGFL